MLWRSDARASTNSGLFSNNWPDQKRTQQSLSLYLSSSQDGKEPPQTTPAYTRPPKDAEMEIDFHQQLQASLFL